MQKKLEIPSHNPSIHQDMMFGEYIIDCNLSNSSKKFHQFSQNTYNNCELFFLFAVETSG